MLMDNMAYLDKIAESNRPAKTTSLLPFSISPKILIGIGIVIFVLFAIMIFGSIFGGDKNTEKTLLDQISLRSENLGKTIDQYNKNVKSSKLRSMGSSLSTVLSETSSRSATLLAENFDSKKTDKSLEENESAYIEEVNTVLENARLNGLLDRAYVREMTYQIGILLSMESECSSKSKKTDVKDFLTSSMSNLDSLYTEFSEYSDETN
ncbi:hypothetical protein IJH02_02915 [Candidatus Saccharibacteria bacterium]|nr:hypothetical protein [Candidatus Saccharibacteria bacterium]